MQAFSVKLPRNVIQSLRAGLKKHRLGFAGKGLTQKTVTSAQHGIKNGRWPKDKIVKASAWFARHDANFQNETKTHSPIVTAWQLWGGSYGGRKWIDAQAARIKAKKTKGDQMRTNKKKRELRELTNPKRPQNFKLRESDVYESHDYYIVKKKKWELWEKPTWRNQPRVFESATGLEREGAWFVKSFQTLANAEAFANKRPKGGGSKGWAKANPALTAAQRRALPDRAFGFITKRGERKYPLMYPNAKGKPEWSEGHAIDAIRRVRQHGSPSVKKSVYTKIARHFPELAKRSEIISEWKRNPAPKPTFVRLGDKVIIELEDGHEHAMGREYVLATDENMNDIYLVKKGKRARLSEAKTPKSEEVIAAWTAGGKPVSANEISLPNPHGAKKLGNIVSIKYSGPLAGRPDKLYIHEFKKPYPALTQSLDGSIIARQNSHYTVTRRGIVG